MSKKETPTYFRPDYSALMDSVEKKFHQNQGNLSLEAKATSVFSTGLLNSDLMLGGGIFPGTWMTVFGGEGSAKSTHLSHFRIAAAETGIPVIGDYDYEGCVTDDTLIQVNGEDVPIRSLIPQELLDNLPTEGALEIEVWVDSVGSNKVRALLYFGGVKPITKITVSSGEVLKAHNHPVLVVDQNGELVWRKCEDLSVGDIMVRRKPAVDDDEDDEPPPKKRKPDAPSPTLP